MYHGEGYTVLAIRYLSSNEVQHGGILLQIEQLDPVLVGLAVKDKVLSSLHQFVRVDGATQIEHF